MENINDILHDFWTYMKNLFTVNRKIEKLGYTRTISEYETTGHVEVKEEPEEEQKDVKYFLNKFGITNVNDIISNKNSTKYFVLHYAITVEGYDTVKLLLEGGADPNMQNDNGDTPIVYAFMCQLDDIALLLLRYKADIYIKNLYNHTPYDKAIIYGDPNTQKSVKLCISVNAATQLHETDENSRLYKDYVPTDVFKIIIGYVFEWVKQ